MGCRSRNNKIRPQVIPARQTALILSAALLIEGVVDRDVSVTEQGAVADNAAAVEPREAQRPTSLAARTPSAAIPGNGDIAVGAMNGPSQGP